MACTMIGGEYVGTEEVVKVEEVFNGQVIGKFYCIRDSDFEHWMSKELFGDAIWTKDFSLARKFRKRKSAEMHLSDLQTWRIGKERRG